MKKAVLLGSLIAGVSVFFFCFGSMIQAQDASSGPDSVTLAGGSFGKVTFSHKGHGGAGCKDCHHKGETPVMKCAACHSQDSTVDGKTAFHKNCIECHKTQAKGPTGCMDCHKKE